MDDEVEAKVARVLKQFPTAASIGELATLCRAHGVPAKLRPSVWRYLLLTTADSDAAAAAAAAEVVAPPSPTSAAPHRLLQAAPNAAELAASHVRVVACLRASLRLPERAAERAPWPATWVADVAAPFVALDMSEADAHSCARALAKMHLPHAVSGGATCAEGMGELLRLLVYYYDPRLALHLDQRGASPRLYAHAWFATLFVAAAPSLPPLVRLWDWFLAARDPLLLLPAALALLLDAREALLAAADRPALLELLCGGGSSSGVQIESEAHVDRVVSRAQAIHAHLPPSFKKQLHATVHNAGQFRAWIRTFIAGAVCMHVAAADIFRERARGRAVFLVDVRAESDVLRDGGLPTAFPLPASMLLDRPQDFDAALESIRVLQDDTPQLHFALCGTGNHDPSDPGTADLSTVSLRMLRAGFRHVSVIHRGFEAVHALGVAGKIELAGHRPEVCRICAAARRSNPAAEAGDKIAHTFKSLFDAASEKMQQAGQSIRQAQQQQQQRTAAASESAAERGAAAAAKQSPFNLFRQRASEVFSAARQAMEAAAIKPVAMTAVPAVASAGSAAPAPSASTQSKSTTAEPAHAHVVAMPPAEEATTTTTTTTTHQTVAPPAAPKAPKEASEPLQPSSDGGVFTIDDDLDDEEDEMAAAAAPASPEEKSASEKPAEPEEASAAGQETASDGFKRVHDWVGPSDAVWDIAVLDAAGQPQPEKQKGVLVVTDSELVFLERSATDPTRARSRTAYKLAQIAKVVFRKSNPKHTIIRFTEEALQAEQFLVDDSVELIRTIKERVEKAANNSSAPK